jgi:cytochrome P450
MLLLAQDEEADGARMDDRQARDEAVNLLLGGNETTATALTWTLHLLARAPEEQEAIRREAQAAGATVDATRLVRAERAFKEALRLDPPAYVLPRVTVDEVELGGHRLARGTGVNVVSYVIHRDPRWFAEPERFRPDRFADEDAIPRGAYLPFGLGPRACIGRGFALMEGSLALARVLARYRLRPRDPAREVEVEAQVSLHPRGGLPLLVEEVER